MSVPRLDFDDLAGGYGTTEVVHGISGAAAAGQVLCIVGRNGVGKSSLIRMLSGHLPAWRGTVRLEGRAVTDLPPAGRRRLGISYCPQERPVFDDLTVRDNLILMRRDRSLDGFAPFIGRFPVLERRLDQQAGTMSGGEKKILSFARGLAEMTPLVLLDEPSEGVQWENILHMADLIRERRAAGTTFVVVEQNLAFAEHIADRYLVLDQGRVVLEGPRSAIDRAALLARLHV